MTMNKDVLKKPELLAPAGDWPALFACLENGADAVYFGVRGMNMRHLASNFELNEIPKVVSAIHEQGLKGYVTLNTVMLQQDIKTAEKILRASKEAGVDAVIAWDMAVVSMANKTGLPVHISTQASVANMEAVRFFAGQGARRIVLARECTLEDIRAIVRQIKEEKLDCAVEAFVHGAMCVSVSGRCFLSQHAFGMSANRGQCLQPCRREFQIKDKEEETEYILGEDYVLSPKDLCSIEFLDQLIEAGISAFKIEGRMRAAEYVKTVTGCYRRGIDAYFEGAFDDELRKELKSQMEHVYNRGFSSGFYFGQPDLESWSKKLEHSYEKVFVGQVTRFFNQIGVAEVHLNSGKIEKGEELLFSGKTTPARTCRLDEMKREDAFVDCAQKGDTVGIKVPFRVRPKDKVFIWKSKE